MAPARRGRRRRGLSLVELMIGMVVALLVGLAAVSSLRVFTASQRQATAAGTGLVSASGAMGLVKNDVAVAGLGFFDGRAPLCDRMHLSMGTNVVLDGTPFQPIRISRVAGQDQLDLVYASNVAAGVTLPLWAASDGSSTQTLSTLPTAVGQAVLLAPPTTGLCTLRSVTAITAATVDTPQVLAYGNTGLHNQGNFATAPAYAQGARLGLVGTLEWHRYRVSNGNLVLDLPLAGNSSVLVRNVVAMRVHYGVADLGSTTLAGWRNATDNGWGTLDATNIGRVRALRLGLVVRSTQREKPDADGTCTASTSVPVLFDEVIEPDVPDWQCWRFRSTTVVVPLRNLVWGQTP